MLGRSRRSDIRQTSPIAHVTPWNNAMQPSVVDRSLLDMRGLDDAEAAARLLRYGHNTLDQKPARGIVEIVRGTLKEPMFLLLLAAAGLYLVIGDLGEGLFLTAGAMVSVGLVVLQEARSERALAALRKLAEPNARAMRGGIEKRIPARDLVPGDLILAGEGERIPADAILLGGDILSVDESMLTGESVPVAKLPGTQTAPVAEAKPGGDHTPFLFAGTLIVGGQGVGRVTHTGAATQLGRIGASLATIETEPTLLQRTSARLIAKFGIAAFGFCAIVALAYGVFRHEWFNGALAGITLAISLLPEEFPMVLAIFMAIGSWRLARHKVLVRRAAVLETLGAATMLCVDKTGTLTQNRMAVAALWVDGELHDANGANGLRSEAAHLLGKAALASALRSTDPMDRALRDVAGGLAIDTAPGGAPIRTHPLQPNLLAFIQAWPEDKDTTIIAAKGAPEAIFKLCRMDEALHSKMHAVVAEMAERGLRVLGVASHRAHGAISDDLARMPFTFEGLVGFFDPVRADVPAALAAARGAGIEVAMITGDYPATALEIAKRCGIDTTAGALSGHELVSMDPAGLRERVKRIRVFARIVPEQKLALVEAFKANGEIVAMTGDGVNDAPALEAAHIGIAMGERGTDVAREAADIVLLDDSFASIVEGVKLGRRIFANLRKALTYVTAIHLPIAGLALFPIVFGLPPLLFPLHVVLLELVIDPVCSLVFEAEPSEEHAMKKPPRPAGESLFGRKELLFGVVQGAIVFAAVFGLYVWMLHRGTTDSEARALAFTLLIAANLVLAFAEAAEAGTSFFDSRRAVFWAIAGAAVLVVSSILYAPYLSGIFQFAPPRLTSLILALSVALVAGGWFGFLRRTGILMPRAAM
jgi:Ca2+-transporting ATPase